jgi:hypothetical protein
MLRILVIMLIGLVSQLALGQAFVEVDHVDLKTIDPTATQGGLGTSMAMAGNRRVLVAAPLQNDDSDPGSQDGSVYSFRILANGSLDLEQVLAPSERYQFGTSLAADGDWAAISQSGDKVQLYRTSSGQWAFSQQLRINPDVPPTAGVTVRSLRSSSAMDGNLLAIGDTTANVVVGGITISNAGAVILFRRAGNNSWNHEATLIAPDPVSSSDFGEVLALSGNTLLVGASNDAAPGGGQGGAHIYERQGGNWGHIRTLRNPDVGESSAFGWSVAVDGDIAVVGCATCFTVQNGPTNTGSFFSFERHLGGANNWGLRGEFIGSQPLFIDEFSASLYLRDQALLVGSPNANYATFFLRNASGGWTETQILPAGDPDNTSFGRSVAFDGGAAIIGASRWPNTSFSERWGAVSAWFSPLVERCGGQLDAIYCDRFEVPE